jgi:Fe-S cluster biogenesis protein NfuA/nitrite reductase/ring-hydroxylating ferredoxin subunit
MARNARTVGDRIEELLSGLQAGPAKQTAEELVRLLVEMYGEGLARVVAMLEPEQHHRMTEDDLLESLLLLHDLHPLDLDTRIQRALDRVRPYLGSHAGGVEYLGVDDNGVAQLRLEGNCHGCPSSTLTVKMAIEGAITDAAPEIVGVEVAGVTEPEPATLLQISLKPPPGWGGGWAQLPELGPPTRQPVTVPVEGTRVLICSVRGTLYAYRDSCAACESTLGESTLDADVLTCATCGARFDVHHAGTGLDDAAQHLDPLPLLSDSRGVRVAVPT